MAVKDISILICTHNREALLGRTLASIDSLKPVRGIDAEVVVVANACSDGSAALAEAWAAESPWDAKVVVEPRPGLSIARNRSVAESTGKVCAFLDDDVRVDQGWLQAVAEVVRLGETETGRDDPADGGEAAFGGGRVKLWWEESERPAWFTKRLNSLLSENDLGDQRRPLPSGGGLVGANFWIKREVFDAVGLFREDLGRSGKSLVGAEETELIKRAETAGFSGVYEPKATIEHWVPASRVNRDYLTGVAKGNEYGRVRMKPRMGPAVWLRCFLGHLKLALDHGTRAGLTRLIRGRDAATHHATIAAKGWGGLRGMKDRWLSK